MPLLTDKVMFEVYRDLAFNADEFRVVYYTELDDHNKEHEIARAQNGEPFFDGFLLAFRIDDAKRIVSQLIERMNRGEVVTKEEFRAAIAPYVPAGA